MLLDSAAEQAQTLYRALDGQYTALEMLAACFGDTGALDPERIVPYLDVAEHASLFNHIILDLPDGSTYLSNGHTTNVSDRLYFQQSMTGIRSIEYVRDPLLTGASLVILSVPIRYDDAVIGVVHGSYQESDIVPLLIPAAYNGQGRSFLCDDLGNTVVASEDSKTTDAWWDFSTVLVENLREDEARRVLDDLAVGQVGTVRYRDNTGERFAVYAPLEIVTSDGHRWYIVNDVPETLIDQDVGEATSTSIVTMLLISIAAVLAVIFFLWRETLNKRKLDRELDELALREEQYRIVAQQSRKNIFRYDIKTHTSYRDQGDDDGFGKPRRIENVPESVMDLYAEESREEYREFFRQICDGSAPTACVVSRMRNTRGEWRWVHSDATVIFDAEHRPIQAIVSYYDVTEQREKELLYQKWRQEKASISPSEATIFECDLTHDTIDHVEGELLGQIDAGTGHSYTGTMKMHAQSVAPDDRASFVAMTNKEWLIGAYYNGEYAHSLDYRVTRGDESYWVNVTIQLAQYPDTNDIKAFLVVRDIDRQKREELSERASFETDRMTTALNRECFFERASAILHEERAATHALFLLDVDNLKQINDTHGHQEGDRVLIATVEELRKTLRERDLIGRIGGDEFMVFLRNVTRTSARARAASICQRMVRNLSDDMRVSVSLGVSLYPSDGIAFDELYKNADDALYRAKNSGRNGFAMFGECGR